MRVKTTGAYVRRPLSPAERQRAETVVRALTFVRERAGKNSRIEVHLHNRQNPNGIVVSLLPHTTVPRIERFISHAWARKHGYSFSV